MIIFSYLSPSSPNSYTFPKTLRVRKNGEYKRLSQKGKRLFGHSVIADYLLGEKKKGPRMGITVSKKFGKAHERNRFKRLVREAFRLHQHVLPPHIAMNIRPQNRGRGVLTLEAVSHDLKKLFSTEKRALNPVLQ